MAATEAPDPTPRPFPSEERLEAAKAFTDGIEADAAELAKQSALSTDAFASLLAHRESASGGDSFEGSLSGLVKCQRCNKVMFSSVKAHHITLCKIRQAIAATGTRVGSGAAAGGPSGAPASDSDWQQPSFDSGIDVNGGSKGRKRKQQHSYDNPNLFPPLPIAKSRFSRDSSHRSGSLSSQQAPLPIDTTTTGDRYQYGTTMQPPLSPMLAAAAGLRQGRSAPSRERRRQLLYLPNQDLEEPLILNRSSIHSGGGRSGRGAGAAGGPVPLRLASQNSEELKNRTGTGPVAAVTVPVPSQQQQGPRVMSTQQAHQMYQHIQQLRAAQGAGAVAAAMVTAPAGLQPHQQQLYLALPPQVQQQFVAQLQYAQQVRQQQQQAAGGRGPGAPVLQGRGGGTLIPANGIHQAFNTSAMSTGSNAMSAAMYHQFVPSNVASGFVPVQQHPTVPQ